MTYTLLLDHVDLHDLPRLGGKNASLGELLQHLAAAGVRVPHGFALTVQAFWLHLQRNDLEREIYPLLDTLGTADVAQIAKAAASIRERICNAPLPAEIDQELSAAYAALCQRYGDTDTDVAVRSSATAEDLPTASFAGQQETFLNVRGKAALVDAVRACMASLFTDRAIVYRRERGMAHRGVGISVGVQKMVRSDLGAAGVVFTLDPETGFRDLVVIHGAWGLGESVVQGRVNPDEFTLHKPSLRAGKRAIVRREAGDKSVQLTYAGSGSLRVQQVPVPDALRRKLVLSDDEVLTLGRWALAIEDHYSAQAGKPTPMDLEWAKDGRTGELYVLQARPETVHAPVQSTILETYRLDKKGTVLVRGRSVGTKIGCGAVRMVRGAADLAAFRTGEVLVASMTDPDWESVLKRAAAVITDQGGRTCHAAIISRELGIPCIVGTRGATTTLREGQLVTVSCAEGESGFVYDGALPFLRERIDPATLPAPRVPILLNVGNPENAYHLGLLPSGGVGLLRIEFVVSAWIGIHPMALLHPERVTDTAALAELRARAGEASSLPEYFVERLAAGVAQVGAAFWPRPVVVRFSDFKTNEYADLLGGAAFEPHEANPMIGFRGASRYYDERYREAFGLECQAIRRVRDEVGLTNVKVMIPFCRTLREGRAVLREMERHGLRRGERGLEVWVMCEIPNNVVLAAEFCELFDGFSIGSNDLTQLTLGVDRDSALLAHVFDERDPGVKRLIATVIATAHEHGRKVSLCGQAPSDDPAYAQFLADTGIDSISVTADALAKVVERLARKGSLEPNAEVAAGSR
jgi:pyruvate,water dikinase